MATYGAWNTAYAVAQARNAAVTYQRAAPEVPNGPANITANSTASASPPPSRYGRRAPIRVTVRSEIRPTTGLISTSHALGSSTSTPASPAATPSESVRYGSSSNPGTVPNAPVASVL